RPFPPRRSSDLLAPASRLQLADWLIDNPAGDDCLRAGIGDGWRVGDKTGSNGTDTRNDIAIVWPLAQGRPWTVAAYLQGARVDSPARDAVLARAGELAAELVAAGGGLGGGGTASAGLLGPGRASSATATVPPGARGCRGAPAGSPRAAPGHPMSPSGRPQALNRAYVPPYRLRFSHCRVCHAHLRLPVRRLRSRLRPPAETVRCRPGHLPFLWRPGPGPTPGDRPLVPPCRRRLVRDRLQEGRRQEAQPGRQGRGRRLQGLRYLVQSGGGDRQLMARRAVVPALLSLALLAACTPAPPSTGDAPGATPESTGAGDASASPADAFLAALASHCGQAFAGRVVADQPAPPAGQPDPFAGKALVMHVRGCDQPRQGLRIPFHVGEDRSRTWVLTRTPGGLRLE